MYKLLFVKIKYKFRFLEKYKAMDVMCSVQSKWRYGSFLKVNESMNTMGSVKGILPE